MTRPRAACAAIAAAFVLSACKPPKYVSYRSIAGDWTAKVPWGWNVITDRSGDQYLATTFLGAFDPEFYLGVPSFSVRWHAYSSPHRLRDGSVENYASADDYVRQTLDQIYGANRYFRQAPRDILVAGRRAKHFIVLSPAPVPRGTRWGTSIDVDTKRVINLRQHAYVVLPMSRGFYALIYPATRDGFPIYEGNFNQLVNTFTPASDGPGGPKIASAAGFPLAARP